MRTILTVKISGNGAGNHAPTADDWLDQLRDYLEILRGVERALADDGQVAVEWRVVNAGKASPLRVDIEAYPAHFATDVTRRAGAVIKTTAAGLHALASRPERPPYFTDEVIGRAKRVFERVTNGIDFSEIYFGNGIGNFVLTPESARNAANNATLALKPIDRPYKEFAAIEGHFHRVELDGHGHSLLWIRHRLTGDTVKCQLSGAALATIEQKEIREVFRGNRIVVMGMVHYKTLGRISQIHATDVKFYPSGTSLPSVDEILDDGFTGGLASEEYLEKLRDGHFT